MKNGITIGGRVYEFLAYSQSSLREATVWFLTPFELDGKTITAQRIRDSLGDFRYVLRLSHMHKPLVLERSLLNCGQLAKSGIALHASKFPNGVQGNSDSPLSLATR